MSRRAFLLTIVAACVALYQALSLIPKKWFMWFVVGRRLESERNLLTAIVQDLPGELDFPYGKDQARVVVARNPDLRWEGEERFPPGGWVGRPNQEQISRVVDQAVVSLLDAGSVREAYAGLFRPDEIVAIKVIWTGFLEVVDPIIRGLISIGMPPENIFLYDYRLATHKWWDRKRKEEKEPLLLSREPGYRVFNEFKERYGVSITGGQYHSRAEAIGSQNACFEGVLYQCDALINVPSLKTHSLAETTLTLKNHQGSHNLPHKLHTSWDVSCALLNHVPVIREKTRLVVCDATAPLYHMGPQTSYSVYTWKFNGVIASRDPVAADTVGLSILAEKRKQEGFPHDFPRSRDQLRCAEMLRLGRHSEEWIGRIDLTSA